jgi:hypothetical protein
MPTINIAMNRILLKSYGRAGSHLIVDWFLNINYNFFDTEIRSHAYIDKRIKKIKNFIIKDHSIDYIPSAEISTVIILKRKDLLLQALSELIARRTEQWVAPYKFKKFKPFFVDERIVFNEIKHIRKTNKEREKICKKLKLNYIQLYYEDFSQTPKFLTSLLNIENNLEEWTRTPSPYKANELISNYDDLRNTYNNMLL